MNDKAQSFLAGIIVGDLLMVIIFYLTQTTAPEYYQRGIQDCQQGNLRPVIHIEDGDTTITYKMD